MENFFIEDRFYHDLTSFMEDLELIEIEDIDELSEDWEAQAQDTKLEKMFSMSKDFAIDAIIQQTDKWEERFPEDSDILFNQIKNAINQSIDIEKLNSLLPELYYPNGKMFKITKKDLLEYIS